MSAIFIHIFFIPIQVKHYHQGTKKVVALDLNWRESDPRCLLGEEFDKMPNLRYLRAGWAYLAGDFKHHLSELRWLQCQGWSDEFTPTNCSLENLVILNLSNSNVTDNWEGWRQIKMATKLKVLHLSDCSSLCKPLDFSLFVKLERLSLRGCLGVKLTEILGLGGLESLEKLNISGCELIQKLPDLSKLTNLKELYAWGCVKLTEIGGPEELKSLELLDLRECKSLEKLLYLSNLTSLRELLISQSVKLSELPGLEELKALESLTIDTCESIEKIPDLSNLEKLRTLSVCDCVKLTEIRGLEKLKSVDMYIAGSLLLIQNLPHLPNISIRDGREGLIRWGLY